MNLPRIPPVSTIGTLVTRILGHNPGPRTLQGTNSYLVGLRQLPRVLIDTTAQGPGLVNYLHHLSEAFSDCSYGCPLSGIILTHWHPDHTQAVSAVLDLARQKTSYHDQEGGIRIPVYKYPGGPDLQALGFYTGPVIDLHSDALIPIQHGDTEQLQLRVIPTPGHTEDHICLLLEVNGQAVHLFTGDMILGHGSTTVHDLFAYMHSLGRIRQLVSKCEQEAVCQGNRFCLCPGHGLEVERCVDKVDEYLNNREARIDKVREFFMSTMVKKWIPEDQILTYVYPGVSDALLLAARLNLRHSLFWLAAHKSDSTKPGLDVIAQRSSGESVEWEQFQMLLASHDKQYRLGQTKLDAELYEKLMIPWEWMRKS